MDFSLVLLFASVLSLVVALDGTCSPFMLHRNSTCFKMAHPHEPSQEGLLCLPAYSQVYGGDLGHYMRRAGKDYCEAQISSHMSICSFVQWGKWGAMPQFCKITSSWLLLYMFLTKLSKNRLHKHGMKCWRPLVGPVLTTQDRATQLAFTKDMPSQSITDPLPNWSCQMMLQAAKYLNIHHCNDISTLLMLPNLIKMNCSEV